MAKAGRGKRRSKGGKNSKKKRHPGVGMRYRPKPRKELYLLPKKKDKERSDLDAQELLQEEEDEPGRSTD